MKAIAKAAATKADLSMMMSSRLDWRGTFPCIEFGNGRDLLLGSPICERRLKIGRHVDRSVSSDAAVPVIAVIFPVAALSHADGGETVDQFDPAEVFRHLVADLPLDPCTKWRAVFDGER